jgi:hypothetical protein
LGVGRARAPAPWGCGFGVWEGWGGGGGGLGWCSPRLLGLAPKLLCAVTRAPMTDSNLPMALPSGWVAGNSCLTGH